MYLNLPALPLPLLLLLRTQVAAMQRDSATYVDEPEDAEDFAAWRASSGFSLDTAQSEVDKVLAGEWFGAVCLHTVCKRHCGLLRASSGFSLDTARPEVDKVLAGEGGCCVLGLLVLFCGNSAVHGSREQYDIHRCRRHAHVHCCSRVPSLDMTVCRNSLRGGSAVQCQHPTIQPACCILCCCEAAAHLPACLYPACLPTCLLVCCPNQAMHS
jgi:hypothetical protein